MRVELTKAGCSLIREAGDPRISHESTVGYHMKKLLNGQGYGFVRINPSNHGLTSCRVGMIDRKQKIALWHERYAIENAATEFNHGEVYFQRVDNPED